MLAVAGLAAGGLGSISSAVAQQQQGAAARDVANWNATALNQRADMVMNETRARQDIQKRENARKQGATIAAYGAAGVDMQGTPLDVAADQATEGELQTALIGYGGQTRAMDMRQQALLMRAQGEAQASAGNIAAGSTLLTGAGRLAQGGYNLFGGGKEATKVPNISTWGNYY